ncbi:MAG: hypothetical protein V3T14_10105 [Myxococcota bacterium]
MATMLQGLLGPLALLFLLGPILARPTQAQQEQQQTLRFNEATHALGWLRGRFRTPVTCMREDGTRVELEEAVVIRDGPRKSGRKILKVTFFGIDVPDATKCFNLMERRLPDRRGVLYVTYRSHRRPDMGINDFRRALRSGDLRYPVVSGQLGIRPIGSEDRKVIHFDEEYTLHVRPVGRHSDGEKLLALFMNERLGSKDPRRRLWFELEGPEGVAFAGAFIEAEGR